MKRGWPAFSNFPLRDKGLVVVSLPVLALLIALSAMVFMQRAQQEAERLVRHTQEVRQKLQLALTLLVDAETGTRGYLLTEQPAWLEPYQNALRRFPVVLGDLEKLVGDSPVQKARVGRMKEVAGSRLEHLVVLQGFSGAEGGTAMEQALARSKTSMDAVRGIFAEMQAGEEALLAARSEHLQRVRRWLYGIMGAAVAAGLAGGLVAAFLFGRHVSRRIQQLTVSAHRLAARQPLGTADTGGDEIGACAAALRETDRLLEQREDQLREARTFLEHLVETSPTVIFRQDPRTLQVIYVSANAERILGYTPEEILGEPDFWMMHIHPEDRQEVIDQDSRAFASRVTQLELEYRFQHKDGAYRWIDSFVRIEYDAAGRPSDFLGHRLDITGRKRTEEALREREANLDAANKELEAFSYSVSHDLRAPLRSIDGFSLALMEDYSTQLDDSARSYLQRVRAATQRMGELIDDLLNLSRVTRSPLRRTQLSLSAVAESIARDLRQAQPAREVEFAIAPGLEDDCDPNLIRVVLENLLGNAWKFTSRHARARIEFGQSNGAYFVQDDGAGFDPTYKSKLFGAFQRLHHSNDFSGTGIGLATVQRIIHRHGGRVWAEGAPEKGATFHFTLHPE
jgi:PAS domain S-box-containing protein